MLQPRDLPARKGRVSISKDRKGDRHTSDSTGAARFAGALKGTVADTTTFPLVRDRVLIELVTMGASGSTTGAALWADDWAPPR